MIKDNCLLPAYKQEWLICPSPHLWRAHYSCRKNSRSLSHVTQEWARVQEVDTCIIYWEGINLSNPEDHMCVFRIKLIEISIRDSKDTVIPGVGNGNPLQYSLLENVVYKGTWQLQSMGLHRVGHDWACTQADAFIMSISHFNLSFHQNESKMHHISTFTANVDIYLTGEPKAKMSLKDLKFSYPVVKNLFFPLGFQGDF